MTYAARKLAPVPVGRDTWVNGGEWALDYKNPGTIVMNLATYDLRRAHEKALTVDPDDEIGVEFHADLYECAQALIAYVKPPGKNRADAKERPSLLAWAKELEQAATLLREFAK